MLFCEQCGFENRESAKFCGNCGAPLTRKPDILDVSVVESAPNAADTAGADSASVDNLMPSAPVSEEVTAEEVTIEEVMVGDAVVDEVVIDIVTDVGVVVGEAVGDEVEGEVLSTEVEDFEEGALPSPPKEFPEALVVGSVIKDRYLVTSAHFAPASVGGEDAWLYTVEDHGLCPRCGADISFDESSPFCGNCGSSLKEEEPAFCDSCGHSLEGTTSSFCDDCGALSKRVALTWPRWLLQENLIGDPAPDEAALPGDEFLWGGRHFILLDRVEVGETENGEEVEEGIAGGASLFPHGVHLSSGQRSDVGIVRQGRADENSIFALTLQGIVDSKVVPSLGIYVVADGMGGHGFGEVASAIAAKSIGLHLMQSVALPLYDGALLDDTLIRAHIEAAIQLAHRRIFAEGVARDSDLGTTVTMAVVVGHKFFVANVGDSRTYLWDEKGLTQITEDHSLVYASLKQGAIQEEELYSHPARNVITRSLGPQVDVEMETDMGMVLEVEVDHYRGELTPGALLLLCCDGLWEMLRSSGIADVLMMAGVQDPQVLCDELIRRTNEAGGEDNISVVVVRASA